MRMIKTRAGFLAAGLLMMAAGGMAADDTPPLDNNVTVTAPIETVYAPQAFDANDTAKVVVQGTFPNSCYRLGVLTASVTQALNGVGSITLSAPAYFSEGQLCLQILIPFTEEIELGSLSAGTYQIQVAGQEGVDFGELVISDATSTAEEPMFVSASDVDLVQGADGHQYLTVSGHYPYMFIGCMVLEHIETEFDGVSKLVVEPIAFLTDGTACAPQSETKSFSRTVTLNQNLPAGQIFLYMKVLSGDPIEKVVNLD